MATADHEFSDAARQILERLRRAFDADQAALLLLDGAAAKLTCVAATGFPGLTAHCVLPLVGVPQHHWNQARAPRLTNRQQDIQELFGSSQTPFLSSIKCFSPLRVSTGPVGALVLGARQSQETYGAADLEALEMLAPQVALVLHNHSLAEALRHQIADNLRLLSSLHHSYDDALEAFATTIDSKDTYLRGHSVHVARFSAGMATTLGMNEDEVAGIRAAAHLHDIGKVTVDKQTHLVVSGIDRQRVGQVAAEIRNLRRPDPYKQKGVRYTGEVLKKKAGKAGATGAK